MITKIDQENRKINVVVTIFDRRIPLVLAFDQVTYLDSQKKCNTYNEEAEKKIVNTISVPYVDEVDNTSITVSNSITSIGDFAFAGCSGLTSITIPDSVTSIADYAFEGCDGFTSITIPESVTSIGKYAFGDCTSLQAIHYTGTIHQWEKVRKGESWNSSVPAEVVQCSDGEFVL